jgi:hypothetical protein
MRTGRRPAAESQSSEVEEMTTDYRRISEPDLVAQARALLAAAGEGVRRLEGAAQQAFCRLAALAGMLARLEGLAGSHEPEDAEAAALDAATVCREAEILLRYIRSGWAAGPGEKNPAARVGLETTRLG